MKTFLQIIGVLIFLLTWGIAIGYFKTGSKKEISLPELKSLNGELVQFQNSQKKVIYVWATWCVVCKSTLWLVKWNEKILSFFGISFYSIEEGENLEKLREYVRERDVTFPVLLGNEKLIQELGIRGYPTYIFINKNSEKVFFDEGYLTPVGILLRLLFL
ncbi:MAG: TlpA family protein disulfide reductase [Leptospiraceae bacterium]|nr:TlpA family protein disulfide reductase [Leptospiraceae bacterium]